MKSDHKLQLLCINPFNGKNLAVCLLSVNTQTLRMAGRHALPYLLIINETHTHMTKVKAMKSKCVSPLKPLIRTESADDSAVHPLRIPDPFMLIVWRGSDFLLVSHRAQCWVLFCQLSVIALLVRSYTYVGFHISTICNIRPLFLLPPTLMCLHRSETAARQLSHGIVCHCTQTLDIL